MKDLALTTPETCRHCGEPMPARKPSRGRPPVTCSPECRRLYTNKRNLKYRIERYLDAVSPREADRSDDAAFALDFDPEVVDYETSYHMEKVLDPRYLPSRLLVKLVDDWEQGERVRRQIQALLREFEASLPLEERSRYRRRVDILDPDEYEALVARRRARLSPAYLAEYGAERKIANKNYTFHR